VHTQRSIHGVQFCSEQSYRVVFYTFRITFSFLYSHHFQRFVCLTWRTFRNIHTNTFSVFHQSFVSSIYSQTRANLISRFWSFTKLLFQTLLVVIKSCLLCVLALCVCVCRMQQQQQCTRRVVVRMQNMFYEFCIAKHACVCSTHTRCVIGKFHNVSTNKLFSVFTSLQCNVCLCVCVCVCALLLSMNRYFVEKFRLMKWRQLLLVIFWLK